MKKTAYLMSMLVAGGIGLIPFVTCADVNVSVGVEIHAKADFEGPLRDHGNWVVVGSYGRCWHPNGIEVDWRPYSVGQWEWTDCGWYWESDEPWAWACYHYGSWVHDPGNGWVWIPDVEWSPAWVTWRTGGGYIGWAPFAPAGVVVAPEFFGFVEIGHFHDPIRPNILVVNNTTIINKTTVLHESRHDTRDIGTGHAQKVAINVGPNVADVEKATGKKFTAAPVAEVVRRTPAPRSTPKTTAAPEKSRETATPSKAEPAAAPGAPVKPETPSAKPPIPPPPETGVKPATPPTPEPQTKEKETHTTHDEIRPAEPERKIIPPATPAPTHSIEPARPAGGGEKEKKKSDNGK